MFKNRSDWIILIQIYMDKSRVHDILFFYWIKKQLIKTQFTSQTSKKIEECWENWNILQGGKLVYCD